MRSHAVSVHSAQTQIQTASVARNSETRTWNVLETSSMCAHESWINSAIKAREQKRLHSRTVLTKSFNDPTPSPSAHDQSQFGFELDPPRNDESQFASELTF